MSHSDQVINNMKKTRYTIKKNGGFTLIETMVSVFILTLAFAGLLTLQSSSLFSARYARNEITANYLLQEAADYVRNDRDTTAFLHNNSGTWTTFVQKYNNCMTSFSSTGGCYFEPASEPSTISKCSNASPTFGTSTCPVLYYDPTAGYNDFYTYNSADKVSGAPLALSDFKRQVVMQNTNPDELDVKITVEWQNGSLVRSRSLVVTLTNWQQ
jgi:type II secretory pathway pseudopilin PulG